MKLDKMLIPQKRLLLKVFLKTGQTMRVRCSAWEIEHRNFEPIKYHFKGCKERNSPLFLDPSNIAAIELVKTGYFI